MVLMHSVSSCLPVAKVCSVATMKDSSLGRLCHQPMWVEVHGSPITARGTVNPVLRLQSINFFRTLLAGFSLCIQCSDRPHSLKPPGQATAFFAWTRPSC